jgi:hypothetical protein
MSKVNYTGVSPYFGTPQGSWYMGLWDQRKIKPKDNDRLYTLTSRYTNRPDLLAFDLYGMRSLWWVFRVRNPDIIRDPIFDMVAGLQIVIATREDLYKMLSI